jgi:hypothetical protein
MTLRFLILFRWERESPAARARSPSLSPISEASRPIRFDSALGCREGIGVAPRNIRRELRATNRRGTNPECAPWVVGR